MKKKLLLFPVAAGMIAFSLMSNSGGPANAGGQGNLTVAGCSCHGAANTNTKIDLALMDATTSTPVTDGKYVPGKTYTITRVGNNTGAAITHFGFQIVAVNGAGNQAGTFAITNAANTQTFTAAPLTGVEHKTKIAKSGNNFNVQFNWTAPAAGAGTVTFRIAANGVNNDGGTNGDQMNVGTFQLTEGSSASVGQVAAGRFRLFPNPASNQVTLDLGNAADGAYTVKAFDLSGKVLLSRELQVNSGNKRFDIAVNSLPAGLYHFIVSGKDGQQAIKFVKQ